MKKFLLLAVVAFSAIAAKAQVYVGGGVGVWLNDDAKSTQVTISPEVGYTFNEKWSAGVALGFSHYKQDESKVTAFAINPYARYTYYKTGIVNLFVDGGVDFTTAKPKDGDSATAFGIGFKPGVALNVTDNISFVAHFGFLGYQDADDELSSVINKGFGFDFSSYKMSPPISQMSRQNARTKGFAPAFLNLSILVSAPRAAMAMVNRKVSI